MTRHLREATLVGGGTGVGVRAEAIAAGYCRAWAGATGGMSVATGAASRATVMAAGEEDAMDISLEGRSRKIVEHLVETGHYGSPCDAVDGLLRWCDEAERRSGALRVKAQAAIAEGGEVSDQDLDAALADATEALKREGY